MVPRFPISVLALSLLFFSIPLYSNQNKQLDWEKDPALKKYRTLSQNVGPQKTSSGKSGNAAVDKKSQTPVIAFIDLTAPVSIKSRHLKEINQTLWTSLGQTDDFDVYTREAVFNFLQKEKLLSTSDNAQALKPAVVSAALKADYLVYGNITKKGIAFYLKLYASPKGSDRAEVVLVSEYTRVTDLIRALPKQADTILAGLRKIEGIALAKVKTTQKKIEKKEAAVPEKKLAALL